MSADPTLADRLEADADLVESHVEWQKYQRDADAHQASADRIRAAAVRLRKLDAIEEAIGDVDDKAVAALQAAMTLITWARGLPGRQWITLR